MKITFKIAKLELATLFFSPIAWLLLIIFFFQTGLTYTDNLSNFSRLYAAGRLARPFTSFFFGYPFGLFKNILDNVYLYMPLLTMGLISREISSGSIKLLFSSPVKIWQIILGKYLAMLSYCFLLVIIAGIFALCGMSTIKNPDTGLLLSGLTAIYLLLSAYAAIGLFLSCLTSYQVVAAISTLAVFAVLDYIKNLWQNIDFIRDLTYYTAISGRAVSLLRGLITSRDLIYFFAVIALFLGYSFFKLQSGRKAIKPHLLAVKYALLFFVVVTVCYVSSRPGLVAYFDASAIKSNTLSETSQKIIKELDKPLTVDIYVNLLDGTYWKETPGLRNADQQRWEEYTRFKPDIKFNYIYYYDRVSNNDLVSRDSDANLRQKAEKRAEEIKEDITAFKTPQQIRKVIDLWPEANRLVFNLKYNGRSTFLRVFDDIEFWPSETEIDAALKRLTVKLPSVAFATGNYERDVHRLGDRDYAYLTTEKKYRYALINQGFDFQEINLKDEDVPANIATLIIADPQSALGATELEKLRRFVARGGNMMVAGEPGKQNIINPILQLAGVQLDNGILVQPSKDYPPDFVISHPTPTAAAFSINMKDALSKGMGVSTPGVTGLSTSGNNDFKVRPLLVTDEKLSWEKQGKLTLDSTLVVFAAQGGDKRGAFPTAMALSRQIQGQTQKIVISGDADFMSNRELKRGDDMRIYNYEFISSLFSWFSDGKFPVETPRPKPADLELTVSNSKISLIRMLILGIFPAALFISGTALLLRRKNR